jgi:hypothetical protein
MVVSAITVITVIIAPVFHKNSENFQKVWLHIVRKMLRCMGCHLQEYLILITAL